MKKIKTLSDIEALEKEMLIPADIAPILGCHPYTINIATENGANPFPFEVIRLGRRVLIPKQPFLKALRGQ